MTQNFEISLVNFSYSKRPNNEQIMWPSGHTDGDTGLY